MLAVFITTTILFFGSCQPDDKELGDLVTPENLIVETTIVGQDADNPYGDGSGKVIFKAMADNALSYEFVTANFSNVSANGEIEIPFTINGINTYNLVVVANGTGGLKTSTQIEVKVFASFQLPSFLLEKLTGSSDPSIASSKTWRIKSDATAHFGLGPVGGLIPSEWFGVAPFEKTDTGMYDDRYIFSSDGVFTHETNGTIFGREILVNELNSAPDANTSTQGADVLNLPLAEYTSSWTASGSNEIVNINLSNTSFIGYYIGGDHSYELFEYENQPDNEFILRSTDGNSGADQFDWWFIITSEEEGATEEPSIDVEYSNLIWSDEFDVNGVRIPNNWGYD